MTKHTFETKVKNNKELARRVIKTYHKVLKDLSWKATRGNKRAARESMIKMAEMYSVLAAIGFGLSDSNRLHKLRLFETNEKQWKFCGGSIKDN